MKKFIQQRIVLLEKATDKTELKKLFIKFVKNEYHIKYLKDNAIYQDLLILISYLPENLIYID